MPKQKSGKGSDGNTPPPIQRKPSTFLIAAQPAIALKPGENAKGLRSVLRAIDFADIMGTPWTYFKEALEAYTALADAPVTDDHRTKIRRVEDTLRVWKAAHNNAVLNDNERAKLQAATLVEQALPEETEFARPPKGGKPDTIKGIVAGRLEFMFKEALGDDFIDIHSALLWQKFVAAMGNFPANLLEAQLPAAQLLAALDEAALLKLAGKRVETLRGDVDANTKITLFSIACQSLAGIAQKALDGDAVLGVPSQAALLELVENQLAVHFPVEAVSLAASVRANDIKGVNLNEFLASASTVFTAGKPTNVKGLTDPNKALLRAAIKASPEYAEYSAIATKHNNPFNTGADLPAAADEDLAARENELLGTLNFELQKQNAQGIKTQEGLPVPALKKSDIVMAVMTIEKLIGRRLPKYPRFILIDKQGSKYRANADSENEFIRYDVDFEMSTGVHELGHYFENQSGLDNWYNIYLLVRSRHTQKATALGKPADKLYGSAVRGAPDEPGFLGGIEGLDHRYSTEYTARYYDTGHTEMLSMFTERLINKSKMDNMIEADPQAFAILLKALRPGTLAAWDLASLGFE